MRFCFRCRHRVPHHLQRTQLWPDEVSWASPSLFLLSFIIVWPAVSCEDSLGGADWLQRLFYLNLWILSRCLQGSSPHLIESHPQHQNWTDLDYWASDQTQRTNRSSGRSARFGRPWLSNWALHSMGDCLPSLFLPWRPGQLWASVMLVVSSSESCQFLSSKTCSSWYSKAHSSFSNL